MATTSVERYGSSEDATPETATIKAVRGAHTVTGTPSNRYKPLTGSYEGRRPYGGFRS